MKVGDLVQYKHGWGPDFGVGCGIIIENQIDRPSGDVLLVLWNKHSNGRRVWYVKPNWIEIVPED